MLGVISIYKYIFEINLCMLTRLKYMVTMLKRCVPRHNQTGNGYNKQDFSQFRLNVSVVTQGYFLSRSDKVFSSPCMSHLMLVGIML
jgi:hypothetical protein